MKIFADRHSLPAGQPHIFLLYPFWGPNPEDPQDPISGRFDRYRQEGRQLFTLTTLDQADIAVAAHEWLAGAPNNDIRQLARRSGKPTVIFFNHDSHKAIEVENTVVFRTSFYRSKRRPNEFAFPAWSEDFITRYLGGKMPLREKQEKPLVGYCGYAACAAQVRQERIVGPLRKIRGTGRLLTGLKIGIDDGVGMRLRSEAVNRLEESQLVRTNFLLREAYWNGAADGSTARKQQSRREFVENMVGSDYILCVRGAGNFSYRLYETLCCGRIPVFVNTDCVLPYENWINWQEICVWLDKKDLPQIAEKVAAFHDALSPQEFGDLQRRCRRVWEEWLSPTGFCANFYRHFE